MGPKFLIVDDDADILALTEAILVSLGCDVVRARGGMEALDCLELPEQASEINAIFLDLMMPDLTGFEVLKVLKGREHTKDIPVIMLTAKDASDDIINGYQYGADYYIPKPFNREQIIFGLDLVLGDGDTGIEIGQSEGE